jgi:hypothetical protein
LRLIITEALLVEDQTSQNKCTTVERMEARHTSLPRMAATKIVLGLSVPFLLSGASAVHQQPSWDGIDDTPSHIHQKLSEALLEDVLPPISPNCDAARTPDSFNTTFNFTFSSSHPTSMWNPAAVGVEKHAFLVEMAHNDTSLNNTDQAWTLRLGRGGNLYSFVGAYGEAIPPQMREDSPWVDEVWQTVAVNKDLNGQNGYPYFVHQAGTYNGPGHDDLKIPFYSPTIAVHCGGHSCAVAAWGQQAHIPTKFESSLVYINRYTNCNHGVVEVTSLIHNFGDHEDQNDRIQSHEVNYLNVPWAGVRASTLPEILMSGPPNPIERTKQKNTNLAALNPVPIFGGGGGTLSGLEKSGGSTVFAQDHYHHEDGDYNQTDLALPCGVPRDRVTKQGSAVPCQHAKAEPVRLVLKGDDSCQESSRHTKKFGNRVVFCTIDPTVEISEACNSCSLKFTNRDTGANFLVKGVVHWAKVKTRIYFVVEDEVTVDLINHVFRDNDEIHVERYESGVHHDDALALAFVHGRDVKNASGRKHSQISSSFLRFGRGGVYSRDFLVFVVIIRAIVKANQTFAKRHYVVTDRLSAMQEDRLHALSEDVYHDMLVAADYSTGRDITLFGTSDYQWFSVALDASERDDCSSKADNDVVEVCHGWTTPREGSTKLLYIRCANESHIGENFYHFSDDDATDGHKRPYICGDAENDRPEILWLGFFPRGDCDTLVDAKMEVSLCDANETATSPETDFVYEGEFAPPGGKEPKSIIGDSEL